ncbi:MAG: hypothetical protein WAV07_00720 [Candidatus Contendobacter sp.]
MRVASFLAMAVAGLAAIGPASGGESALAEEIWSENFCEQAVSLAKQRGEPPDRLNMVSCRLLNYYQPSYWQCVIDAMKVDASLGLDAARQKCLAEY